MELVLTSSSGKTLRKMNMRATNFDEITSSPEALAEFIVVVRDSCQKEECSECPLKGLLFCSKTEDVLDWLKQEAEE